MYFIQNLQITSITTHAIVWSCLLGLTKTVLADENAIDFNRDIRPILSDKCFKCHGPDESSREADLRLDVRADAEYVLAKEDSELLRRVNANDPEELMPPSSSKLKLNPSEKKLLASWVIQDAPYVDHWSFRTIEKPTVPNTSKTSSWATNEIDHFILRKLIANGISPQKIAPKYRLIRRLYFDLTGLPPSIEQVDSFVNSKDPHAYEKIVDQLLASQEFGEHQASDWLDAARYSDSYGYQVDRDRFVWPWRDWLITAINDNIPYDDFITWQLAGDLLPNSTFDQTLATTFNRLHPQKVEGGSVPEEFRVEYVADRTHTVGTAFLGLSLECARCHDHKYDPLTQKEYYQLFAFFNNIDEAGLYSYFTNSIPTPNLLMTTDQQQNQIDDLDRQINELEIAIGSWKSDPAAFSEWQNQPFQLEKIKGEIKHLAFEGYKGPNRQVEGKIGKAVELTGDDGIGVGVGNFPRYAPFSVATWIKIPNRMERSVVFHRSRAWTDSASRGYQLLIEEGKLSASLIHFWPGNAIRIKTLDEAPINEWIHVAITYDGSAKASGLRLFLNGQLAKTGIYRDNLYKNITGSGGDNITIGQRFRDKGFAKGQIDEFKVFDRQLTEIEVRFAHNPSSVMQIPQTESTLQEYFRYNFDEEFKNKLAELKSVREKKFKIMDGIKEIMVMKELGERRPSYLLKRGAYDAPGEEVQPDVPAALPSMSKELPRNRLGFAKWMTDRSNPLTARVAVNRFWKQCFGRGIVATPEDFGSQGSPPTHPELLDWLAADFMENGWNVKRLLKQIVMSSTYRQASIRTSKQQARDPENLLLGSSPRYRLSAEMLRDNILSVSDLLVTKVGGASVRPYEVAVSFKPVGHDKGDGLYRRSLYTYWKRTAPAPVMMALDAAKRDVCSVKRERTSSPLQSFVFMNDPQFVEACRILSEQMIDKYGENITAAIDEIFQRLTSRKISPTEREILLAGYDEQQKYFAAEPKRASDFLGTGHQPQNKQLDVINVAALTMVTNTIINFDEAVMKR